LLGQKIPGLGHLAYWLGLVINSCNKTGLEAVSACQAETKIKKERRKHKKKERQAERQGALLADLGDIVQ
jgi:CelD/BcsL family acetyltransferase involved in cellulose biosynthesis